MRAKKILSAYERIRPIIHKTPILTSSSLNKMVGSKLYFKCENFQKTGSFKIRGAYNAISQLNFAQKKKGVITHSSGNHAQAVAYASKLLNISATIIMQLQTPQVKIDAVKNKYKGRVVFCENTYHDRIETCKQIQQQEGQVFIHPSNRKEVIYGQGTVALELLSDIPDLDCIFTPLGGGGLLSGTALYTKSKSSNYQVFGAEPAGADDGYRSFHSDSIQHNETVDTIADGLRTELGSNTFPLIKTYVDDVLVVNDREILEAMQIIWERMKIIIEPSSATTLAAILKNKASFQNQKIGLILSGGNVTLKPFFDNLQIKKK